MAGISNEAEAAARLSAAVGLPSYPVSIDETLRICSWLKSRSASAGFLGRARTPARLLPHLLIPITTNILRRIGCSTQFFATADQLGQAGSHSRMHFNMLIRFDQKV